MNNGEICKYVKSIDISLDCIEKQYISELCVKEGYGQSCGGFLTTSTRAGSKPEIPSQKEHFLSYYGSKNKEEKMPTYQYLRCPQLLLFIAEIAGLPQKNLKEAYETLKEYEDRMGLGNSKEKNGNYMWRNGKEEFKKFKAQLHIKELVKVIEESRNWDEVKEKAMQL